MHRVIVLSVILAIAWAANIRTIPIYSPSAEFDNATVLRDSRNYHIQARTKNVTILNVPDVYQATTYTCGPSSLSAVLSYYGKKKIRETYLAELAKTDEEVGTMPEKLHRAIGQLGFRAEIRENMTIALLQEYLVIRRPVIVLIQAWEDENDTTPYPTDFDDGHYVVAIGYDSQNIYF
jgi:predicted double-glycine peptidase